MTLKEIIEKVSQDRVNGLGAKYFTAVEWREVIKLYAREKCREQREICAKSANAVAEAGGYVYIDHESLLNAPEPKFD